MEQELDIISEYGIPLIFGFIMGFLAYIGLRYLKMRKKYGGKIPDIAKDDFWRLKK